MYLTNMFAGDSVYTFELKAFSNEVQHLSITEDSKSLRRKKGAITLTISDEYLPVFAEMVNIAAKFSAEHKQNRPISPKSSANDAATSHQSLDKSYTVEDKRKEYARAYEKWDNEEDKKLKRLSSERKSVKEICAILQRNGGAIRSRLIKLGLPQ